MNNTAINSKRIQDHLFTDVALNKTFNSSSVTKMAKRILTNIMMFRRIPESVPSCSDIDCQKCTSPH
ncbi:MAG: pyoverdine biosynthesis protein PvcA, partial [Gammaproteobacteria bacterium]